MIPGTYTPELIFDVGEAYNSGMGCGSVARLLGIKESQAEDIIDTHFPGSKRPRYSQTPLQNQMPLMTLASLGQTLAGKSCDGCGIQLVKGKDAPKPKRCGICAYAERHPDSRMFGPKRRRAVMAA